MITSSGVFEGNDGPWSTFQVKIGTPQRTVNLLPSNSLNYIIATDSSICKGLSSTDRRTCLNLRGGFYYANYSKSFSYDGLFELPFPYEDRFPPLQCSSGCNNEGSGYFADASSLMGTDYVSLANSNGRNTLLENQLVGTRHRISWSFDAGIQLQLLRPALRKSFAGFIECETYTISILGI